MCVGAEPADDFVNVIQADEKTFSPANEDNVIRLRHVAGSHDAIDRVIQLVKRLSRPPSGILDRYTGDAGLNAPAHILGHASGIMGVCILEVRIHRHVYRPCDLANVREHGVASHGAIRQTAGKSEAGRCGGQRFETEMLKVARGADVPGIGNDEATFAMKLAKTGAAFSDCRHTVFCHPERSEAKSRDPVKLPER